MRTSLESATDGIRRRPALVAARASSPCRPGRPFLEAVAARDPEGRPAGDGRRARRARSSFPTSRCCCRRGARRAPCRKPSSTAAGGRAMTLPQIRPISAGEEDLTLLVRPRQPRHARHRRARPAARRERDRAPPGADHAGAALVADHPPRHGRRRRTSASTPRRRAPTRRRRRRTSPPSWRA